MIGHASMRRHGIPVIYADGDERRTTVLLSDVDAQ